MYLTENLTTMTLVEIGKSYGNRDHSTVLYGIEKIATCTADRLPAREACGTDRGPVCDIDSLDETSE